MISGISVLAMAMILIAIVLLWWYGFFLPGWIQWGELKTPYGEGYLVLKNRRLTLYENDTRKKTLWKTQGDWFVQDVLIKDIDRDGREEIVALVWKHGSYGDHMPFWVKKNDKELKQHVFIFRYEESRENKMRALWMSSAISYEIDSIASGEKELIVITDHKGTEKEWIWQGFGLKSLK